MSLVLLVIIGSMFLSGAVSGFDWWLIYPGTVCIFVAGMRAGWIFKEGWDEQPD